MISNIWHLIFNKHLLVLTSLLRCCFCYFANFSCDSCNVNPIHFNWHFKWQTCSLYRKIKQLEHSFIQQSILIKTFVTIKDKCPKHDILTMGTCRRIAGGGEPMFGAVATAPMFPEFVYKSPNLTSISPFQVLRHSGLEWVRRVCEWRCDVNMARPWQAI